MTRSIDAIIDDFDLLDDWEDKYRYVIELGRELPDMADGEKTAGNKVNGCVSQVWVVAEPGEDGTLRFRGDSDAHIVRGLVAVMISAMSGRPPAQVVAFDAENLFKRIGLDSHLTPQRSNGLRAMVERMKAQAGAMTAA
ncbi:MAG: SufE family protein [Roseitalea sp.]|nr:SufE family protein [Roseitalea sp.]MBO6720510.1 SufE family protein [Roseitalea sp.]MBO6743657.1 SufE family protein [Roseitalea sp.]